MYKPFPHTTDLQQMSDFENLLAIISKNPTIWIELKTLWQKEKLFIMNNFFFCHNTKFSKAVCFRGIKMRLYVANYSDIHLVIIICLSKWLMEGEKRGKSKWIELSAWWMKLFEKHVRNSQPAMAPGHLPISCMH